MEDRLQKVLAQAGIGSRRACEEIIANGHVKVNGKIATLGMKVDPDRDTILIDGTPLQKPQAKIYIALNKPRKVLSDVNSDDPRPSVKDLIPLDVHLYCVGRLDFDSEGLVLLTNDGDLANRLTHPRYGHEKEYQVLVANRPDAEQLEIWRRGVVLEDGSRTAPAIVQVTKISGKGAWLQVILREGKKRQIREVGKTIGLPVQRIIRVRIGNLKIGKLKPGEWRHLTPGEVKDLTSHLSAGNPKNR